MVATPKIRQSPRYHVFADMRNFFGVPNTLNVVTSFRFLVVGVFGLVLCLHGNYFGINLRGEIWGWFFFFTGIAAAAFALSYYHLKPEDARVLWDRLPMMIAFTSLFTSFVIERVDEQIGISSFIPFLMIVFMSAAYERFFNDFRLCMLFYLIPSLAIPVMTFIFSPNTPIHDTGFMLQGLIIVGEECRQYYLSGFSTGTGDASAFTMSYPYFGFYMD